MDIINVLMLVFMTGIFCILSFVVGVLSVLGRSNNNKVKLNPIEAYKENKEKKEQIKENDLKQKQLSVMLDNINNYDGTPRGQKAIPRV